MVVKASKVGGENIKSRFIESHNRFLVSSASSQCVYS
jgi:hypothetical protein